MPEIIKIDNPFRRSQRKQIKAITGETVGEICKRETQGDVRFDCDYVTAINGNIIEVSKRDSRVLGENEFLLIVPKVSGGDDGGKSILNMAAMIALIVVSGGLAAGFTGWTIAGISAVSIARVAIVVAGGMLISSLQPHPKKASSGFVDDEQSQSFGWNPATIQRQGIGIPRFYGLNKMFGNVIAAHTEKESDTFEMTTITEIFYYDRWYERTTKKGLNNYTTTSTTSSLTSFDPRKVNLYALFCLGIGPMREPVVDGSLNLNDQTIENLNDVFYESRPGDITQQRVSYFDKTKLEAVTGRLVVNGTPITDTTTNGNFNDLEIELAFPKGLYDATGGDLANYTVNVTVEIKKTTSSTWTALANAVNITAAVGDKVIEAYTTVDIFAIEYGSNYDIRVTKNTAERDSIKYGDELYLDKVRELIDRQFVYPRRALVGIKALATDQLSGSIRFSCLSRGLYVRQYSNSLSGAVGYSNNPADVIADILTQPVYSGAHSPWDDLKLMLNFEGVDGATATIDDSPKGHSITYSGTATYTEAAVGTWAADDVAFGAAANAGDNNNATFWSPNVGVPHWLSADISSAKYIIRIGLWTKADAADGVRVKDFDLQYSDNDIAWFAQESFQHTNADGEEYFDVAVPSSHRYWRVNVTSQWNTDGSAIRIHELDLFDNKLGIDTGSFKFGAGSFLLDGIDSYLLVTNDLESFDIWENLVENWTLDIEIKMGDHVGTEVICGMYVDANNYWYLRHVHGAGLALYVYVSGAAIVDISGVGEIADLNWHHLAVCKVENKIGIYKDQTQIGFDTMTAAGGNAFDTSDFYIGQDGNSAGYLFGNVDHFRIHKTNTFSATPVTGLTDTIIEPAAAYTDPGNSYAAVRYDGYNPSKLLTADFEDLADWCDDAESNPQNFTIASISKATNAVIVTTNNHNFKVGDTILFRNVDDNGMVEIADETTATILKVTDDTTFTIDLDTSGYTTYEITDGIVCNFEGTDGSTNAFDESIRGYDFNTSDFINGAQISTSEKKFGVSSLLLNGTDEYLSQSTGIHSNFNVFRTITEDWTIIINIKLTDHTGNESIFRVHDGTQYYDLHHNSVSGIRLTSYDGIGLKTDTGYAGVIADSDWHEVVVCKAADKIGLYKDGVQIGYDLMIAGDIVSIFNGVVILLGAIPGPSNYLDGNMDTFVITKKNSFNASPNVGLTDTITPLTSAPVATNPSIEVYQPRFAFNGGFDSESNMWEAALSVCELCRCILFWDGDTIRLAIDKAATSVYAFTMGNILKDTFRQRFIPTTERASELEVHYRDALQDYERQPFTLVNDSIGNVSNKIRLDLFGITDTDMANRLADFKLLQNLNIKKIAMWSSEIDAIAVTIGDVVDVQHDVTNWGSVGSGDDPYTGGGRVVQATNVTNAVITIDGDIYFDDADWRGGATAYKILLKTADDAAPESKSITGVTESSVAGGTFDITVSGVFTANPQRDDIWAAGVTAYETNKYRIVNIRQTSEQRVEITAIEYKSEVYAND